MFERVRSFHRVTVKRKNVPSKEYFFSTVESKNHEHQQQRFSRSQDERRVFSRGVADDRREENRIDARSRDCINRFAEDELEAISLHDNDDLQS